jgi:predicted dithiol-disulfide oxidoreductase (DUF899 family)
METLYVNMSGEQFLDAIDAAANDLDRDALRRIEAVAFARRDLTWQAAARHADNYIVATKQGNAALAEVCAESFRKLVPAIRAT